MYLYKQIDIKLWDIIPFEQLFKHRLLNSSITDSSRKIRKIWKWRKKKEENSNKVVKDI